MVAGGMGSWGRVRWRDEKGEEREGGGGGGCMVSTVEEEEESNGDEQPVPAPAAPVAPAQAAIETKSSF